MSALGQKRTFGPRNAMSALPPKADISRRVHEYTSYISGHKDGVAGAYNRVQYLSDKRSALDQWAHHLRTIIAQATG